MDHPERDQSSDDSNTPSMDTNESGLADGMSVAEAKSRGYENSELIKMGNEFIPIESESAQASGINYEVIQEGGCPECGEDRTFICYPHDRYGFFTAKAICIERCGYWEV
jgi:hypothetical protein